jgi:hypothetical protein
VAQSAPDQVCAFWAERKFACDSANAVGSEQLSGLPAHTEEFFFTAFPKKLQIMIDLYVVSSLLGRSY